MIILLSYAPNPVTCAILFMVVIAHGRVDVTGVTEIAMIELLLSVAPCRSPIVA